MKIKYFQDFYMLNTIAGYKSFNKRLLKLIEKMPANRFVTNTECITRTDWNLPKDHKREYLSYFYENIRPTMFEIAKQLKAKQWSIWNGWYQQYKQMDYHNRHRHDKTNWTNIYYVEAPTKSMLTKIKNPFTDEITTIEAEEGTLVTLPGHVLHTSPKFKSTKRKTIISFNSCFHD